MWRFGHPGAGIALVCALALCLTACGPMAPVRVTPGTNLTSPASPAAPSNAANTQTASQAFSLSALRRSVASPGATPSYEAYRWALETDDPVRLQALVSKGLGPNLVMPDGHPALQYAMEQGSARVVDWLLHHPQLDVRQLNGRGDSALLTASALGEVNWVDRLILRGAEADPAEGWTPLHYAAANNRVSLVEYLLRKRVRLDALSPNGTTPLMMAARSNSTEIVKRLLVKGARADLENQAGFSALAYARRNGNDEMERMLLDSLKRR